jgi:hypothetical protein
VDGLTIVPLERAQRRWERRLVLSMTMKGEDFEFVFWPIRRNDPYPQTDLENQRDALFESLQDFIAQSNSDGASSADEPAGAGSCRQFKSEGRIARSRRSRVACRFACTLIPRSGSAGSISAR